MRNVEIAPSIPGAEEAEKNLIRLCLFDLDDTLLQTKDLETFRGEKNCGQPSKRLIAELKLIYRQCCDRYYYEEALLESLRDQFPDMMWGIFTRAPHYYAKTLLELAYPNLNWDCVIANETVARTKPYGEGILRAMQLCNIGSNNEVVLVGDCKADILAAYSGGCRIVLDRRSWPSRLVGEHYHALEKVPDCLIDTPKQLGVYLANPDACLPELEYQLSTIDKLVPKIPRVDGINHFYPYGEQKRYRRISTLGRFMANYRALEKRRQWHELTRQILEHKEASVFPDAWCEAIRNVLRLCADEEDFEEIVVTVIPHKLDRSPRLEAFLHQIEILCREKSIHPTCSFVFIPDLFVFSELAVSSHKNQLSQEERFTNARSSLKLSDRYKREIECRTVVVLDDVVTTGATLLQAADCLDKAGAPQNALIAMAKTVSWRQ